MLQELLTRSRTALGQRLTRNCSNELSYRQQEPHGLSLCAPTFTEVTERNQEEDTAACAAERRVYISALCSVSGIISRHIDCSSPNRMGFNQMSVAEVR
jgi:hypothetical protein